MSPFGKNPTIFDRVLDAFATRKGVLATIGFDLTISLGVGYYVQTLVTRLEIDQANLQNTQMRNGYVAISDIQRLVLVALNANAEGGMSEARVDEFLTAADMVYVRMDTFDRILSQAEPLEAGDAAVQSLREISGIADAAISAEFKDIEGVTQELLGAFENARVHLVQFLDENRRRQDRLVLFQTAAVRMQRIVVIANLIGMSLLVIGALVLLRREVLGRQAREKAEKDVEYLAFFDPLTELPNRAHFQDRLNQLLASNRPISMIHVDVDDFKSINDTHGHFAGDEVLRHVARILQRCASQNEGFAARMGGDEFSLLLSTDEDWVLTGFCEEILAVLTEPLMVHGAIIDVGVSIGLATSTQVSGLKATPDLLSRVADFALYASKSSGRGCYTMYDQALETRFRERRAMLEELPMAIEAGELKVFLQPKVLLPTRSVEGFEALVRWNRKGELVPPGEFIALAEESGLVIDIDRYMLNTATKLVADWNRKHETDYSVAINLSALHFGSHRIVAHVEEALWNAALPAENLTLEITETVEMRDWAQAGAVIAGLKELGVNIAIDDFGAGYSSLAYLRTTMADELKIDRSLVEELESSKTARLLLESVINIAQNLGFSVTVEGIETEYQAEIVADLGAGLGQGYLFGRPSPAGDALSAASVIDAEPSGTAKKGPDPLAKVAGRR